MLQDMIGTKRELFADGVQTVLRGHENRTRRVVLLKGNLVQNARSEASGISARVNNRGTFGFASIAEYSPEAAEKVIRAATENALALGRHSGRDVALPASLGTGIIELNRDIVDTDQKTIIEMCKTVDSYIETKYREKFIVDYFHSMSVNEDYDSLYVYPEWSDKGLDIVTIERRQKSTDGYEYADDYAAAYCRQTLESMSLQYFVEKYGEGRAKIYMTMGCDESYSFDGKESPEELLKNDVVWGNGVLFLSESDIAEQDLESVLKEYGEALREAGIETAIGVFLMRADAFESVRYSTYSTMYEDPGMLIRYDVLVGKEGTEIKRVS